MFLKAISERSERDFTWKLTSMNCEPNQKIKPAQTDLKFISSLSNVLINIERFTVSIKPILVNFKKIYFL